MLVWGKKVVKRHVGYVADFCPICACARPFALTRVGTAGHVYFISVGDGDLAGYERSCKVCTVTLRAEPTQYAAMAPALLPILELIQQTFPSFKAAYGERLAFEAALRADPASISPQDRQTLMLTPFMLLSPKVSKQFEGIQLDGGRAFMKREVLPILARALRRLRPTREELKATLTRLQQQREMIGGKVNLDDLMAAISEPAGPDGVPTASAGEAVVANLAGEEGRARLTAGKVMRVLAWVGAAALAVIALAPLLPDSTAQMSAATWVMLALGAVLNYGVYRAGGAVSQGLAWGRIAGIVLGLALLAGFPIGTALGLYLLFSLGLKWDATKA